MSGTLSTNDSTVASIVGTVTDQITAMNSSMNQVMGIVEGVEQHFQATASNAFGTSMNDWSEKYGQIISAYNTFLEDFQGGHTKIDTAHDEATVIAGGFGDHVYNTLV